MKKIALLRNAIGISLLFISIFSFAQNNFTVHGKVTDEKGKPLEGVSVQVKGTTSATATNSKGNYSIATPSSSSVLIFSSVGYQEQEVPINNRSLLNFSLTTSTATLNDVVVVGYGTQRKRDVTGSVAQLNASQFEDRPIARIEQAIQGQMAGVQVRATTGSPGASLQIRVRGTASVNASNDPLYVVDGVPVDNLDDINPDDIQSINVLKDAASTAIYGSRGTNGVVLITTKQGQAGKTKFTFNSYYGIQQLSNKMDLLSAQEWIDLTTEIEDSNYVRRGRQLGKTWSASDPIAVRQQNLGISGRDANYLPDPRWAYGTDSLDFIDWQDAFYRNAPIMNYQLTASGGTNKLTYRLSGNYLDQNGIAVSTNYKLFSVRANLEANLTDYLKMGLELAPSYSWSTGGNVDGKDAQSHHVLAMIPVAEQDAGINSGIAPWGTYYWAGSTQSPIAYQRLTTNELNRQRLLSNMYLQAKIINGLSLKVTGAWNTNQSNQKVYHPSIGLNQLPGANSSGSYNTGNSQYYLFESLLTYNRQFGEHHINVIAGYTAEKTKNVNTAQNASKFANDDLTTLNNATSTVTRSLTTELQRTLLSYLTRLQYNYKDKYLLSASFRRDGSSKFGANTKWGNFPSVGIGWDVARESFMLPVSWVSQLKFRASFGENGNNGIPDYIAYGGIGASNYSFGNTLVNGYIPTSISNQDLHWEKTRSTDVGADMGFMNNRISLSVDYYYKLTTDMLLNVPFALSTGFSSGWQNIGHMYNKGWEFELNTHNIRQPKFQWQTSINVSLNKNRISALGQGDAPIHGGFSNLTQIDQVGQPIGEFYLYKAIGVYKDANDLANSPHISTNIVGDVKYEDISGPNGKPDGIIDANDRTLLGQPDPKYSWGFYNSFKYHAFDLSFLIQGAGGNMIYDLIGRAIDRPSMGFRANALGRWRNRWRSPSNPGDGFTPRIDGTTGGLYDSRWLYDATYARFKSITIGYDLPKGIVKSIASARIYVSGENLFYLHNKDYGGYSPEEDNDVSNANYEYGAYPSARTFTIGINLGF